VGWDLGLDRVNRVATALNVKHPAGTVILVAGTNGKGSCCEALNTLSMEAGLKTGLTTSPHIHQFSERIRIGGRPVEDEEIVAAFDHIEEARGETTLTYFEFASLAALVIFESNALDVAILEVGLGGRLDAMNVVDPDISVVLPIALDHQEYLGDSREQIGAEKAGILRPGQPAVVGDPDPPQSLIQAANSASLAAHYGKEFGWEGNRLWWSKDGQILEATVESPKLPPTSLAAAMQTAAILSWPVTPAKLPSLELLGRQSIVRIGGKTVLLDVAHNPHAVGRLKEKISEWRASNPSADVLAVLGIYKDKAVDDIASLLAGVVTKFYCSEVAETRALSKDRLLDALHKKRLEAEALNTIGAALEEAMVRSEQNDLIVVFGSFPVVGEALNYFNNLSLE
jgi:dihydrofolate synthase/folylpolyglutamate synthase